MQLLIKQWNQTNLSISFTWDGKKQPFTRNLLVHLKNGHKKQKFKSKVIFWLIWKVCITDSAIFRSIIKESYAKKLCNNRCFLVWHQNLMNGNVLELFSYYWSSKNTVVHYGYDCNGEMGRRNCIKEGLETLLADKKLKKMQHLFTRENLF